MKLAELAAYAEEKYHIRAERKWADFPGFSVLTNPETGKWAALLMRQWDYDAGEELERCDIRCGAESISGLSAPYLSPPHRMKGRNWVGVAFEEGTDPELVFRLLDRALRAGARSGALIVLDGPVQTGAGVYRASALPSAGAHLRPQDPGVPQKIREMEDLYEYGNSSFPAKCRNFYRQGKFMEDYEDDVPWDGEWRHFFPTYHDLNIRQLRGYFSWRARARRGDWRPISASYVYLYLYELLNGIGASSPEDTLRKIEALEQGYLDSGKGSPEIRGYLRRWAFDFSVIHGLPRAFALRYADPRMLEKDAALAALREPEAHTDGDIFSALCAFSDEKTAASPAVTADPARGERLFASVWRHMSANCRVDGRDLFSALFGEQALFPWHPLSNAVYYAQDRPPDAEYALNACRSYLCRGGIWREARYDGLYFDRDRLRGLLHEADRQLRRYLKAGHPLRGKPGEAWASPFIAEVIDADRRDVAEAARPKLSIDLSGLDRIRRDAVETRESLLTEEEAELDGEAPGEEAAAEAEDAPAGAVVPGMDEVQTRLLGALLRGEDVRETLAARRLMPSVVADAINEALFDRLGDSAVEWDGNTLCLVEDYREELEGILGGDSR